MSGPARGALTAQKILSAEDRRVAIDMYREGANLQAVADFFHVSRQAIWGLLRTRGINVRPRHPKPPNDGKRKDGPLDWTNRRRDEAGIIVTLRRQDSGELHSLHVPGKRLDALRHVAKIIDSSRVDWRLLTYSSPQTIEGDLKGARMQKRGKSHGQGEISIEGQALSLIDRIDLLDPSLYKAWRTDRRRHDYKGKRRR